jgi:Uma2 family endonuclease
MARSIRWTVSDLELFPDDEKRREIVDGELFVPTQPHFYHQITCNNIAIELGSWNRQSRSGFVANGPGVIFSPEDAVAPDVTWTSRERLASGLDDAGHLRIAPELFIEVLSPGPSNERRDREAKLKLYSLRGVREYWIVNWQQREIEVYRRRDLELHLVGTLLDHDELESPMLPGFRCPVRQIFADLPTSAP